MKVLIHACPARMWYVSEYLVPELTCQGVERIEIYNDARQLGNLRACIDSMERLRTDGDTWHLQDDVLPASDFAERAQELESFSGVICGFVNEVGGPNANLTGLQSALDMWYSFPCIRIPDCMARQFAAWVKAGGDGGTTARDLIRRNVGDDWFFRRFLSFPSRQESTFKFGFVCLLTFIGYCFFVLSPSSGRKYQRDAVQEETYGFP